MTQDMRGGLLGGLRSVHIDGGRTYVSGYEQVYYYEDGKVHGFFEENDSDFDSIATDSAGRVYLATSLVGGSHTEYVVHVLAANGSVLGNISNVTPPAAEGGLSVYVLAGVVALCLVVIVAVFVLRRRREPPVTL